MAMTRLHLVACWLAIAGSAVASGVFTSSHATADTLPAEGTAPTPPADPQGPYEIAWTAPRVQSRDFGGDVIFSADGKRLLVAIDGQAQVWDTATWKPVGPRIEYGDGIYHVSFAATGNRILVVRCVMAFPMVAGRIRIEYVDADWRVWDVETGKAVGPAVRHEKVDGKPLPAMTARMSPDGRWVAVKAGETAQLWRVDSGEKKHAFKIEDKDYIDLFSSDSKSLIVSDYDGHARFWHIDGARFGSGRDTPIGSTWHFTHGRRLINTGFGFQVLDVRTGKLLLDKQSHYRKYEVLNIHFSSNGNRVAVESGRKNETQVWDVESGRMIGSIPSIDIMAIDPEGSTLLALSADESALWSADSGKKVRDLGDGFVDRATFSPDGNLLAILQIVANDRVVRVIRADPTKKGSERWKVDKVVEEKR